MLPEVLLEQLSAIEIVPIQTVHNEFCGSSINSNILEGNILVSGQDAVRTDIPKRKAIDTNKHVCLAS